MKKNLFLISLFSWYSLYSQHPDLIQKWYVQSININGNTTNFPVEFVNSPFGYLQFFGVNGLVGSSNFVKDSNCQIGFGGHISYPNSNSFNFNDFTPFSYVSSTCNSDLINFMNLYVNFFNSNISYSFNYSITNEPDYSKKLTIINNDNDVIVYINKFYNDPPLLLTENSWSLSKIVMDGIDYIPQNIPPFLLSNDVVNLKFYTSNTNPNFDPYPVFHTQCCSFLLSSTHFDISNNMFYSYEFYSDFTMTLCSEEFSEFNEFTNKYIGEYFLWNIPSGPFHYDIQSDNEVKILTITNINNDLAIYSSSLLSTEDLTSEDFITYPNPVQNYLYIENKNNIDINSITIFNTIGQKILSTHQKVIDFSTLSKGTYFVKIITNSDFETNKIIIKN